MTAKIDIPDEVRDDALHVARELGRYPQWFLDLRAGKHRGRVPGALTADEHAVIEHNRARAAAALAEHLSLGRH